VPSDHSYVEMPKLLYFSTCHLLYAHHLARAAEVNRSNSIRSRSQIASFRGCRSTVTHTHPMLSVCLFHSGHYRLNELLCHRWNQAVYVSQGCINVIFLPGEFQEFSAFC